MYRALLCFTPALSKRLIAKGACALPQVRRSFEKGRILISTGTTTAQIYFELCGSLPDTALACGMVTSKGLCVGSGMTDFLVKHGHAKFWYLERGKPTEAESLEGTLAEFDEKDVFIKGANAIDSQGQAGILLGMRDGGTTGKAIGHVMAKGIHFIIPVGLEKSVLGRLSSHAMEMGLRKLDYSSGMPVGLIPVSGNVITEIEAIKQLANVQIYHVASGGVGGAEGSVLLLVKGENEEVKKVVDLYQKIRKDARQEKMEIAPALCHKHRWSPCISKNIFYRGNIKNGI